MHVNMSLVYALSSACMHVNFRHWRWSMCQKVNHVLTPPDHTSTGNQQPLVGNFCTPIQKMIACDDEAFGIGPNAELSSCCSCRPLSTAAWGTGCAFRAMRASSFLGCTGAIRKQYRVPWASPLCCYGAAEVLYRSAPLSLCFRCEL